MATKIFDGFDHYNTVTDLFARSGWLQWNLYSPGSNAQTIIFTTGRNGLGKSVLLTPATNAATGRFLQGVFADRNAEAFFGFACFLPVQAFACGFWLFILDTTASATGVAQLSIHFNEVNYSISVYRGDAVFGSSTLLGTSPNNVWTRDTWQFFEFHPKIASSGGGCEVRVNNNAALTITGANTQATGNAWFDSIAFCESPHVNFSGHVMTIDDFYYNDTTSGPGLVPMNSYAGDSSTVTLPPVGNDSVQFTPFANTNWQEVSELAMDSDVSYNFTSTVGNEDRFNFQTITAALDTVYAVQITGAYRKDDGGTRTIEQLVKSGSTEVYSSGHNIPDTNYAYFTDLWVLNPDTGLNWTKTEINAIKAGYKLTA